VGRVEHCCITGGEGEVWSKPAAAPFIPPHTHAEGQGGMWDKLMSIMDNWYFIGGCLVALIVLIGLYLFLKNKNKDDE
jgi:hypothetical protein